MIPEPIISLGDIESEWKSDNDEPHNAIFKEVHLRQFLLHSFTCGELPHDIFILKDVIYFSKICPHQLTLWDLLDNTEITVFKRL